MRLMRIALITTIILIVSACDNRLSGEYSNNVNAISQQIQEAVATNEKIEQGVSDVDLPASVSDAMSATTDIKLKKLSEQRFDVSVHDVDARQFFAGLTHDTRESIVVSPDISGDISLKLSSVTLEEVLRAVRDMYGYQYEKMSYGYNIFPRQLETRVFIVNHIDAERTAESDVILNSSSITDVVGRADDRDTTSTKVSTKFSNHFWTDLKETITNMATLKGNEEGLTMVQVNPETGIVVVRAFPRQLDKIQEYLDKTQNIVDREVIIEAEILDVTLLKQYDAGIDWSALTASGISNVAPEAAGGLLGSVYSLEISGDKGDFSYVANLLSSQGKVSVLSRPRISALNNQNAIIKIGTDEYFVVGITSEVTTSGDSNNTSSDIELRPFFSGISLDVTPQITSDGSVNLHIHPSITRVEEDDKDVIVDDAESILPLAKSSIREADAVVSAKSGQVIILGGLMDSLVSNTQSGPPIGSGDTALEGTLKSRSDLGMKNELVILIKAVIVDSKTWTKEMKKTAETSFLNDSYSINSTNSNKDE